MSRNQYRWAAPGDVNAFFGLMLDNIAGLVLAVGMLHSIFQFPVDFALKYMIPGTAIGVLVGDLLYFWLAFGLARKENRSDVTAMPLGLDTPSTVGMVLFVLGPAFSAAKAGGMSIEEAAMHTWHIGICAIFVTGLIKGLLAVGSNWIRSVFPRAGLLGSLAAIALVLIAFVKPMPALVENPIIGFASIAIVLVTLIGRNRLPFKIPGALGAVLIATVIGYIMMGVDSLAGTSFIPIAQHSNETQWFPTEWLTVFTFGWVQSFGDVVQYLPYIVPFAIATVIGGIDCTESAASAGDEFETRHIIGIEALATVVASLFGGVIQTTPYIGHPAYKSMGGRAAYTLATAIFVGGAGVIGYFGLLFNLIPEVALLPILIFIGLEITAQSFHATPRRHYAALAIACMPVLAKLLVIFFDQFVPVIDFSQVPEEVAASYQKTLLYLQILAGGFIMTSLIWASATAQIIDRRFFSASVYFALGGILVLFGVMHSPITGDKMFWPWEIGFVPQGNGEVIFVQGVRDAVINLAVAYMVTSALMFVLGLMFNKGMMTDGPPATIDSDEAFEKLG